MTMIVNVFKQPVIVQSACIDLKVIQQMTDYIYWSNVDQTNESQCIQAAYDSAYYNHWPNGDPTNDSQRIPYIIL